jgi:hypothetical protein
MHLAAKHGMSADESGKVRIAMDAWADISSIGRKLRVD